MFKTSEREFQKLLELVMLSTIFYIFSPVLTFFVQALFVLKPCSYTQYTRSFQCCFEHLKIYSVARVGCWALQTYFQDYKNSFRITQYSILDCLAGFEATEKKQ